MTHERTILENETPQSLFGKVSPIADTITNLSKGFGEGAEAERGKEERVREVERPATVPERAPVPTPAPAPAPEGKKEAREALPEICREALEKLNRLERQIEEEVKPGLSDLRKKTVTRDEMETYVKKALQPLAQDHVYLHGLSSQLDQFEERRRELEKEYESTLGTYQTLSKGLEEIEIEALEYLSRDFQVNSREIQQARANFLVNVMAKAPKLEEELKNREEELTEIIEKLQSYSQELEKLEAEVSDRRKEVEERKEELERRCKIYDNKLKDYQKTDRKLKEVGLLPEDEHPDYVSSKYKSQVEETGAALSYADNLSKGYKKLAEERIAPLKKKVAESLEEAQRQIEKVREYRSKLAELVKKYRESG